ncbi:hypothetical protein FQB35_08080 [Crassaminicella thermophila]|uniref:Uncharacterized protein n=1 Tax=Crassaminicella thermophila TaxID=2599308 RepID=A0A5C0SF19_CRATE|nr:ABC-three component system middle component 2 [Crassaminicella thermophila]QEK12337.1 hypothetical protein FQB35_08080 [Crassaminicella thermophila]
MERDNRTIVSNLVMDSIRVLIVISKFKYRKTFKLTIDKIMLYDFIMKFPNTILENNNIETLQDIDFFEYYSYYHWKPNQSEYLKILNYLISKRLIVRRLEENKFFYLSTSEGKDLINLLESSYKHKLDKVATIIKEEISKLSDTTIENKIMEKVSIQNRFRG